MSSADRHSLDLFGDTRVPVSRYYQREAESSVYQHLRDNDSTLIVMATGLGKTQIFASICAKAKGRVLVLAHRKELIEQAKVRLELVTGEPVGVEMAGDASHGERLVVGSFASVKNRLERLGADAFSLLVVDEAHHAPAATYRKVIDFFGAKVLGVTATPDRGDEQALGKIFDSVAYIMDISDGIEAGYLVPLAGREVFVEEVNLADVKTQAGDLAVGQLDEVMLRACHGIVAGTLKHAGDRRGIAFFPGVQSAEFACNLFNEQRPDSAVFISGTTDPMLRDSIVEQFKKGRWQFLCNCQIATEGFDAPDVSLVIHGRPTKSRALYAQMTGRGTRVLPGVVDHLNGKHLSEERRAAIAESSKKDCLILDFVGNAGKHDLCSPVDLLGGDYEDAEIKQAKKLVKETGLGPKDALEEARRILKAAAQAHAAAVKSRYRDFNPFELFHIREDDPKLARYGSEPATAAQLAHLKKAGITTEGLTKGQASRLLDNIFARRRRGLATPKQLQTLRKHGVDKINISFERAGQAIDYIASSGWRPDANILQGILK